MEDPMKESSNARGNPSPGGDLALILDGGGARAAYQLGVLRWLVSRYPEFRPPIITGVSAGAINATFLAAHPGSMADGVRALAQLWSRLTIDQVFRVDVRSLVSNLARWGVRLVSGGGAMAPDVRALVDTAPLRRTLGATLRPLENGQITGIASNLEAGRLHALAIITSSYSTGQSVVWVQGCQIENWERPYRRSRKTRMTVDHVMASAALPLLFPAVLVEGTWHGDGGIRLMAPCSPALHLGARHLLAISTRHHMTINEADRPLLNGYPPPIQVSGQLLNAVFFDDLDRDVDSVRRLNRVLAELPPEKHHGFRPVDVVVVRPSQDLARLAVDCEPHLPRLFRHLTRSLGSRETKSPDILSLLMFQPDYLTRLIELGEADAEDHADEIGALLKSSVFQRATAFDRGCLRKPNARRQAPVIIVPGGPLQI